MKIKGYLKVNLSRPQIQSLLLAAKLEMARYKDVTSSDFTEAVNALNHVKEKLWGWLNFTDDEDKEPLTKEEWDSLLFAARVELNRYKDFEVRHLRSDLQDLDQAVLGIGAAFQIVKVKA